MAYGNGQTWRAGRIQRHTFKGISGKICCEGVGCIDLNQDGVQLWAFVEPKNSIKFMRFTCVVECNFFETNVYHVVIYN